MGSFYMATFGSVLYSNSSRGQGECLDDTLLLGEDMFNTLYPEARINSKFFDSLLKLGDEFSPDVDDEWLGSGVFTLLWSYARDCWLRWDDDAKKWREY